ncbi:MAG: hypothetical protein AB1522_11435 [Chloroflexota bacterium]
MLKRKFLLYPLFLSLLISICVVSPAEAKEPGQQIPADFYPVTETDGVTLYRKDYSGGTPDYVLRVNLAHHAALEILTAALSTSAVDPAPQPLDVFWEQYQADEDDAFCVISGPFFSDPSLNPALGLKANGALLRPVSSLSGSNPPLALLEVWDEYARISPYTAEAFQQSAAPVVVVSLSAQAANQAQTFTSRTLIGLQDGDGDELYETLFFFSSKTTRQSDAIEVLRSFGAQDFILLADGDFAQMNCEGLPYVFAEASIPSAIGVRAGFIAEYEAVLVRHTEWPIAAEGEAVNVEIVVRNNGSQVWQPGEVYLANLRNDWGAGSRLEISAPVAPGETVVFSFTSQIFKKPGVYTSQWTMQHNEKSISPHPIVVNAVILPQELAARKQELEDQVREWARQKLENIEELILNWIESQVRRGFDRICPSAALLPAFALLTGWVNSRLGRSKKDG